MRLSTKLVIVTGLALMAQPALAFTYVPSSATPSGQQLADPDAAFDNEVANLRDQVVTNNLRAQGGPLAGPASNFAPGPQGDYGFGLVSSPDQQFDRAPADAWTNDDAAAPTPLAPPHP